MTHFPLNRPIEIFRERKLFMNLDLLLLKRYLRTRDVKAVLYRSEYNKLPRSASSLLPFFNALDIVAYLFSIAMAFYRELPASIPLIVLCSCFLYRFTARSDQHIRFYRAAAGLFSTKPCTIIVTLLSKYLTVTKSVIYSNIPSILKPEFT